MLELPVVMRPYRCRHVTDDMRRIRDKAWQQAQEGS